MNILTDSLDDFVIIRDRKYGVNSDFKTMIKISETLTKEEVSPAERMARALTLFYKTLPENLTDALAGMKMFYKSDGEGGGEGEKLYSFSVDAPLIYSAFYSQYHIDLNKENMHFRKFITLFSGLCGENVFTKAVSVRGADISSIKNENLKNYYRKMKNRYSLSKITLEEGLKAVF